MTHSLTVRITARVTQAIKQSKTELRDARAVAEILVIQATDTVAFALEKTAAHLRAWHADDKLELKFSAAVAKQNEARARR